MCHIFLHPLYIFGLLSHKFKLLLILNEQITANCFVFIYDPIVYLACVESVQVKKKQEAHGPQVAHLSDIATADMQMLSNIFPILSSQLMKRSSFKQFLILKKKIYGMPVN